MRLSWKVMTVVLVSALMSVMAFSKCGHERCHRSKRSTLIEIMGSQSVTDAFYKAGNLICRKCDPGQYMQIHCQVNHTQSKCTSCPPGTFNPTLTSARRCRQCTDCTNSNAETVARCTATSNAECRCPDGYGHLSFDDTGHGHDCVECAARGKMISVLIKDKDERSCILPCPDFQFYNEVAAECKQCTDCEASGNVTIHRCTFTADTVCERPPPATTAGDTKKEKTNGGLAGGSIAAIVVPLVVVVMLLVVLYCCYHKCKKNRMVLNKTEKEKEEKKTMIENTETAQAEYPGKVMIDRMHVALQCVVGWFLGTGVVQTWCILCALSDCLSLNCHCFVIVSS